MNIDELAREAGEGLLAAARHAQRPPIPKLEARGRRRTLLVTTSSVAAVVVILGTATFWPTEVDDPPIATPSTVTTAVLSSTTPSTSGATTTALPAAFPATRSAIGLGWESVELPISVVALCHQAVVATDTEIVFWGGDQGSCDYEFPTGDPGMAYNPDTGMWRQLAASPLEAVVAPTGAWTGSEVLICCGFTGTTFVGGREIGTGQAAFYDPRADTWRGLSDAPLDGPLPNSVWNGTEMFVVTQHGVAAYNPVTDAWRTFSTTPVGLGRTNEIVWTGSEIIVWPIHPVVGQGQSAWRVQKGMALDPTTDTWRVFPDPPAWPAWPGIAFTGEELIIWGGLPGEGAFDSQRAVGSRLDLRTNTWTKLPEILPDPTHCRCGNIRHGGTLTWTGEYVLVSPGMFSAGVDPATPVLIAYHPETDTWILVDDDSPLAWGGNSLSNGERLIISGVPDVFYVSPPGWQPSGDVITADSWRE